MDAILSKGFVKQLKRRIEGWNFEAGILDDKEYKLPRPDNEDGSKPLGEYAGGDIRKASRVNSGLKISEVFRNLMIQSDIDLLQEPFEDNKSDIMKFTTQFLRFATGGKVSVKRVENLLQAVIRNPILRNDYGYRNTGETARAKGFFRPFFDTAQTFKAIKVKAKKVG